MKVVENFHKSPLPKAKFTNLQIRERLIYLTLFCNSRRVRENECVDEMRRIHNDAHHTVKRALVLRYIE